ncbi:patatin-like phospholipase family protein [Azospirillum sp. Sh1]|uniref:patatin-like phospholipase family protein n=1 Tax=Azospirillum sp. Sh1 TaxID=2607285 RepID=UPI0011EBFD28|nr:patatin-like phospholipase family protein [Azospirillum sp. Sh1]KAA0570264.1 patatin-like phospholipase family protein [Azospirillum sp. Sh1]
MSDEFAKSTEPVTGVHIGQSPREPEDGMALCLSGGGYRAMLFHVGALWRLYEAGLLRDVKRISSVSGGSITSAVLALAWKDLDFKSGTLHSHFVPRVVDPIRAMAGETIDADSIILGIALPGRISDRIAGAYDRHLFKGATLQDLPDDAGSAAPRFVINATNVQSGALWRFMRPYMRDYRVGEVLNPTVLLAQAVAASSAFPPLLSPFEMRLDPESFVPGSGLDLQERPYTSQVLLTDGGVYDNLGLETAWKRYKTILVSDGGGKMQAQPEPKSDWGRHAYRVLDLIDNQVRSLRKRQLIDSYQTNLRQGAYWGIRTNVAKYPLSGTLPCPQHRTLELAVIPTRLKRLPDELQERLINWGYAVCDAALRAHVDLSLKQGNFPYARGV